MNVRECVAVVTLAFGMAMSGLAMVLPPSGVIDASVLNLMAQLLVFSGACLGIDVYIRKAIIEFDKKRKEGEKDETGE